MRGDPGLSGLRLDALEAFVVLAERMHFTSSARALHLSPSGLSRRIEGLERTLGTKLFHRTTRDVSLSEQGRAFLPHAVAVIAILDAAARTLTGEALLGGMSPEDLPAAFVPTQRLGGASSE